MQVGQNAVFPAFRPSEELLEDRRDMRWFPFNHSIDSLSELALWVCNYSGAALLSASIFKTVRNM